MGLAGRWKSPCSNEPECARSYRQRFRFLCLRALGLGEPLEASKRGHLPMGDLIAVARGGSPQVARSPAHPLPFCEEGSTHLLGDQGNSGASGGVEARHDPRGVPVSKDLTEASAGDPPAGGHLREGIPGPLDLGLPREVGAPGVGETAHTPEFVRE